MNKDFVKGVLVTSMVFILGFLLGLLYLYLTYRVEPRWIVT